jgi:hypothetical protein
MVLPAFKRISTTFAINKQKYFGMGIVSPKALYFVINQKRNDLAIGLMATGGALGGLIAGAIGTLSAKSSDSCQTCEVKSLDIDIRRHPDWPYSQKPQHETRQVLIVPRDIVYFIEHPSFTNFLIIKTGQANVKVEYLLFRGRSIRDYLYATGWPLKWCGELLIAKKE